MSWLTGIRNHQRELLRREVGYMRCSPGPYLMKSAEGFGKTSSHFPEIQFEMFDIASAQPWGSPALFGCFAFRSYQQAEEKANEFREQHPECNRAAVIKSFHSIYREFCEQEDERPIDRGDAAESTLSSYLAEIRTHQPKFSICSRTIERPSGSKISFLPEPPLYSPPTPSSNPGMRAILPGHGSSEIRP